MIPHPPHPLHEAGIRNWAWAPECKAGIQTALTHVNYLSCTRQSSRCACPCVNGWMCMWLGVQRGACVYYTTSPAANQLSSEPHHWALGRGPTTTEQDGTGRPSFSSKRGAQAPRQACDQTLSWICSKFIPEPKEGRIQERKNKILKNVCFIHFPPQFLGHTLWHVGS